MAGKGIRGGLIPPDPGAGLFWNDPKFEPIWKTMADLNIVLNLHSGPQPGVKLPPTMASAPGAGADRSGGCHAAAHQECDTGHDTAMVGNFRSLSGSEIRCSRD